MLLKDPTRYITCKNRAGGDEIKYATNNLLSNDGALVSGEFNEDDPLGWSSFQYHRLLLCKLCCCAEAPMSSGALAERGYDFSQICWLFTDEDAT